MIDPVLERRLSDCRTLLQLWSRFQEYFEAAVKGQSIPPENERRFLELKSRIAMLHDNFMAVVEEKSAAIGQNMLENVNRAITLKHISRLNSADVRKMQIEWHETYLLVNEAIGALEEEQMSKAKISKSHWRMTLLRKTVFRSVGDVYHNWGLRLGLVAIAIIFVLVALPMMGVFSYGALRDVPGVQIAIFWAVENVIRPNINKNLPWRSVDEAIRFGRKKTPVAANINDIEPQGADKNAPRDAESSAKWLAAKVGQDPKEFNQRVKLAEAKDFQREDWLVGGTDRFECLYFLMDTVPKANEVVGQFRQWVANLPPPAQDAANASMEICNDYNLVILLITTNGGLRGAFSDRFWEIPKVKR